MSEKEFGERLFQQAFDLWINPEIERRKSKGEIPNNFSIQRAQVVMNVGQSPEVRLNEEMKARMAVRVTKPVNKGAPVYENDFDKIYSIDLTDADPNAAHLTLFNHRGQWLIFFDFRYNGKRINEHLIAAKEFLDVASDSFARKYFRAFYENLFAATELCAKAWLLSMPTPKILNTKKHKIIQNSINGHRRLGNIQDKHAAMLNQLWQMRHKARYLNASFTPNEADCNILLETAKDLYAFAEKSAPKRPILDEPLRQT